MSHLSPQASADLRKSVANADPSMRALMVAQASERAKSQLTALASLDQRSTQAASIQAAAAAVAVALGGTQPAALVAYLSAEAAIAFAVGAAIAFLAVQPEDIHYPGTDAMEWPTFQPNTTRVEDAQFAVLEVLQLQMDHNLKVAIKRASRLTLSLAAGTVGAALIAIAAAARALLV